MHVATAETSASEKASPFLHGERLLHFISEVGFLSHMNTTGIFMTSCKSCVIGEFGALIVESAPLLCS